MNKIKNLRCLMCGRKVSQSENPLMCDKCKDRMEDFREDEDE